MTENATTPVPPITRGEIAAAAILALTILAVDTTVAIASWF
jgi:hypothetical protein